MDPTQSSQNLQFLRPILETLKGFSAGDSQTLSTNYLRFLSDMMQFAGTKEVRQVLSSYGKSVARVVNTAQGIRFIANREALDRLLQSSPMKGTWEERKVFWLSIANYFNVTQAGADLLHSGVAVVPGAGEVLSSPVIRLFVDSGMGDILAMSNITATAYAGYNYCNVVAEAGIMAAPLATTVEKVMHASSLISSAASLLKVGSSMAGYSSVTVGLGVLGAVFGGIRFFAAQKLSRSLESDLGKVKYELLKTVEEMYTQGSGRLSGKQDFEQHLEDFKEIHRLSKEWVSKCTKEKELLAVFALLKPLVDLLQERKLIGVEIGAKVDDLMKRCSSAIEAQENLVGSKLESLRSYDAYLTTVIGELEELGSMDEPGENALEAFTKQKVASLLGEMREETAQVRALLLSRPDGIDIKDWLQQVNFLTGDKHRQLVEEKIRESKERPELFELLRI